MRFKTKLHEGWIIGDPHFGRDFRNGMPLHRRGEREAMQRQQFRDELATPDVTMVVMVGDLFDKPFVPLPILSQVIHDVLDAAVARPNVTFVMMPGNHDLSRQTTVEGAWEIFNLAVSWLENIYVVDGMGSSGDVAFFGWDWGGSAREQVERFGDVEPGQFNAAIGHWDLMSFGGDDSHIAPTQALVEKLGENIEIYGGHYHEEGDFPVQGITVHCTGSMQPYAHGEGDMYVTLTVEEALARDDLKDMCVRILLEPGETMPDIDCLQLTKKMADTETEEVDIGEIGIGNFNMHETLAKEFAENDVPPPVQDFIKERMGAFA